MATARKPRRKSDGSYELPAECFVCGSSKMEINSSSGKYHCWTCNAGGVASTSSRDKSLSSFQDKDGSSLYGSARPSSLTSSTPDDLTEKFPIFAEQECIRRRVEPQWLIKRYNVRWSMSAGRLWFPAGDGGVLRSVIPWETPKTLTVVPLGSTKGLVGEHLLSQQGRGWDTQSRKTTPDAHSASNPTLRLVVTEGDWKACSIPVPWTGIATQGTKLSQEQRDKILLSSPRSVTVMLDGGCENEAQRMVEQLLPFKATRVNLPYGCGPDDIPRSLLVNLLLMNTLKGG